MMYKCIKLPLKMKIKTIDVAAENIPSELLEYIAKNVKLDSRGHITSQFRAFLEMCAHTYSPQLLVIRGEWGEGKTTIYETYANNFKEEYDYETYYLRMDNVINALKIIASIWPNVLSRGKWITAAIIFALRETLYSEKNELIGKITEPSPQVSIETYIENNLNKLCKERKFIIFFIDEFEAIMSKMDEKLGKENLVDTIINGIRGIRGGELNFLRGKISLHLILAMTPYAYNEYIRRLGITWRGWEERRKYIIDLHPLTRSDVRKVITKLSELYFNITNPLKTLFSDERLIDIYYTVSQGNLGALINLYNHTLMYSKQRCKSIFKEDCLCKIDHNIILNALKGFEIYTYVGRTPAIDNMVDEIINKIRNPASRELFKLLIASSSILFEKDLEKEYGDYVDKIVEINSIVNNLLGISRAIFDVYLYEATPEIITILQKVIKGDNDIDDILIRNVTNSIQFELKNKKYIIIPYANPKNDLELSNALEIFNRILSVLLPIELRKTSFKNLIKEIEDVRKRRNLTVLRGYTLTPMFMERVYPPPPVFALDFITERALAVKLWREAARKITEDKGLGEKYIRRQMIEILKNPQFGSPLVKPDRVKRTLYLRINYGNREISIPTLITAKLYWNKDRALELSDKDVYFLIIFTSRNLASQIDRDLAETGLNKYVIIPLNEVRLIQLYSIFAATKESELKSLPMDKIRLHSKLKEILSEIDLQEKIREKITELIDKGYVLSDPLNLDVIRAGKEDPIQKLLNYYAMYLYGGRKFSLEDLWKNNLQKLEKTILFGRKIRKPTIMKVDIESLKPLCDAVAVLRANKLIKKHDSMIEITMSPVENNILFIARRLAKKKLTNKIPVKSVKEHFISIAQTYRNVFEDFYLKLLELRGLIEIEDNYIKLLEKRELYMQAKTRFSNVMNKIRCSFEEIERPLYHIVMFKKKRALIIFLDDILRILEEYNDKLDIFTEAQLKLFIDYLDYVDNILIRLMSEAKEKIVRRMKEVEKELEDIKRMLEDEILIEFNSFIANTKVHSYNIKEYTDLKSKVDSLRYYLKRSRNELRELIKKEWRRIRKTDIKEHPLYYGRDSFEEAYHFNYILYKLSKGYEDLNLQSIKAKLDSILRNNIKEINDTINNIKKIVDELRNYLENYDIPGRYKTYLNLDEVLEQAKINVAPGSILTLDDISEKLRQISGKLKRLNEDLINKKREIISLVKELEELRERINNINKKILEYKGTVQKYANILNLMKKYPQAFKVNYDYFNELEENQKYLDEICHIMENKDLNLTKSIADPKYLDKIKGELDNLDEGIRRIGESLDEINKHIMENYNNFYTSYSNIIRYIGWLHKVISIPKEISFSAAASKKALEDLERAFKYLNVVLLEEVLVRLINNRRILMEFLDSLQERDEVKVFKIIQDLKTSSIRIIELIRLSEVRGISKDKLAKILIDLAEKEVIDIEIKKSRI